MPSAETDYCSDRYWNGLIKMGMSRMFILAALREGPMHGYDIARRVARMTDGCCSPTAGALYPALSAFEQGGYLSAAREVVGSRERKVYALTPRGEEALAVALRAWSDVTRHLGGEGAGPGRKGAGGQA